MQSRTSSSNSYFKDTKDYPASTSRLSSFQSGSVDPLTGRIAGATSVASEGDSVAQPGGRARPGGSLLSWRRLRAWLASLAGCGPEWKGVQGGRPLSSYQRKWCFMAGRCAACRPLPALVDQAALHMSWVVEIAWP
jgi:hypothetical protein